MGRCEGGSGLSGGRGLAEIIDRWAGSYVRFVRPRPRRSRRSHDGRGAVAGQRHLTFAELIRIFGRRMLNSDALVELQSVGQDRRVGIAIPQGVRPQRVSINLSIEVVSYVV